MTEDESSFLTITELAGRLGKSASAIREWRRAYRDLIPERVGRDGYHRYSLTRFEEIAALHGRRLPTTEVRARLARRHESERESPTGTDATSFEAAVLDRLDRMLALLERIADRLAPEGGRE